jgi:hypothetical protein
MNTETQSKRTGQQNRALHLWCEMLAQELTFAGISQRVLLEAINEVDNSAESVKSVFRALGKAKYLKSSTAELTTKECSDIYEEFNRNLAKIGIHIEWPSAEQLSFYETYTKTSNHKLPKMGE